MNDPRSMDLPYRSSPTGSRRAPPCDQQRRAAAFAGYDDFEYDYDTMPANGPRLNRSVDNTPRSHPPGFLDGMLGGPPQRNAFTQGQWPKLLFGQAALQLHTALVESKTYYQNILRSFEKEIGGVKAFARPVALELLWQDKIEADVHPHGRYPGQREASLPPPPPALVNFGTVTRKLKQALYQACNARARRLTNSARSMAPSLAPGQKAPEEDINSLHRLVKKLKSMWQGLNESIVGARKSHKEMSDLINELDMLLKILEDKRGMWEKADYHGVHGGEQWAQHADY